MNEEITACLYCGNLLKNYTGRQKFCSDRCRVYWNRGKVANDKLGKIVLGELSVTDQIPEQIVDQIIAIRNRPKPSYITQKAWDAQKKKEISDLTKNITK